MASTERSLGWATGVASTDGATTYDSTRFTVRERSEIGVGVLLVGSYLTMSTATSTLTIADGAAVVGGYFYESNGAVTITAPAGSATYTILIIANTSASALTVSANGAGTTTVAVATTRIALVTAAQLSTIGSAITGTNYITLGTVQTSAGNFTNLTPTYTATARSRALPNAQTATYTVTGTANVLNSTATTIAASSSVSSPDGTMRLTPTINNGITVPPGTYLCSLDCDWDINTTGVRQISISGDETIFTTYFVQSATNFNATFGTRMQLTTVVSGVSAMNIVPGFYQNSGATRTVSNVYLRVSRIV
jgi:hypothetical protein